MALYELLHQLNIPYQEVSHAAVYTIEEAERLQIDLPGVEVKNLFIKDKTHYFLYCLPAQKRADLKSLRKTIESGALTFAREDELLEKLGLTAGSVTPLGLVNNTQRDVTLLIDKELLGLTVWVHPNTNTKTMSLTLEDLLRLMEYLHVQMQFV